MSKQKGMRRSRLLEALKQKSFGPESKQARLEMLNRSQTSAPAGGFSVEAAEPTGSCRYADGLGQIQCESPVTKSYCGGKSGFFTPDGRC